jgi:hypothetical protein
MSSHFKVLHYAIFFILLFHPLSLVQTFTSEPVFRHPQCKYTSLAYDPSKLKGINIFVLKSNTIYFRIIFANRVETTRFIKFFCEIN